MKQKVKIISFLSVVGMMLCQSVSAMDVRSFEQLANNTIRQMDSGVVGDIDELIAIQEQLMIIGMEGGVQFLQENPRGGTPLVHVIENAESMKKLTLDQIEELWHGGGYLKSKGIDPEKIDHFGPMMSLMDSVIHPATSYLLIKEYKRTGNRELLSRVKAELYEVLEHVKHIHPEESGVRLTANE